MRPGLLSLIGWAIAIFGSSLCQAEAAFQIVRGQDDLVNLLRNPGFEETRREQLVDWQPAPLGYQIDPSGGRNGSVGLVCEATNEAGWHGASQTFSLNRTNRNPLVVRGWSRAETVTGGSDSGYSLYVDLVYGDGSPLWGQTGNFRTGTHDWEQREFVIIPEKPVRSLTLHCIFRGHAGRVWFDDVEITEIVAPAGSVVFQGTPMSVVPPTLTPPTSPVTYRTGDGLELELGEGRVTGISVDDRDLTATVASGFLAWDVGRMSDVYPFVDLECPELQLRLETTVTTASNHLAIEGHVVSDTIEDRAILLAFALPLQALGWTWHDDIRRHRLIGGSDEFFNALPVGAGTTGTLSAYPLACVEDGRSGLALAIDMASPALYRLVYHAGTQQFLIVYDFGLVPDTANFPSAAKFRFLLFRFEPRWGFRAAWQKLMEITPDSFAVRSPAQGIWMPFTDVATVQGWEDFGFRYHEGHNNVPFDDLHDILSFRYTEPMTWWMAMDPNLPRTLAAALDARDAYADGPAGFQQRMAVVSQNASMFDAAGEPALLFRNEPWANGAVWSLNPNPSLPADPDNAASIHWNAAIREELYGSEADGDLDGEYLDSLEGYVTASMNYRREHFPPTTVPLAFAADTRQPGLFKGLAVFEFTRWISGDLRSMGKLCFANGVPYRFSFLCPWLDVMGTETDWLVNGQYQPASHTQMSLWRTLAGPKPYLLLMNTDFERFGSDQVERYFQRSLFYGMWPSMFSHNASENPYWQNPAWYNRDRPLFRRYIPLVRQVAEAGWQPVTGAVCDNSEVLVERFGPGRDGATYFTLFNNRTSDTTVTLNITAESLQPRSPREARELVGDQVLPWTDPGWTLNLAAQSTAVVRVDRPARFRSVSYEAQGVLRLTVEAPLGSTQVLESSTTLTEWTPQSTNTIDVLPQELTSNRRQAEGHAFYRLRLMAER